MRLFVDAMCAEYGGIRTYVEQLLAEWPKAFPDDELHVAVPAGSTLPTPGHVRHELVVRRPSVVGRPLAQTTRMRRLVRDVRPDAVLVTAPTTSVRRLQAPMTVVILDLRFELRPDQFSRGRRLLRRVSYARSYQLADAFIAISQRSLDDLHRLHPETRSKPGAVAHLGADHVHSWPAPTRSGPAVAFAHHSNKNPHLLVEAWQLLGDSGIECPLTILGASGQSREDLQSTIRAHRLDGQITLSPFLPDAEFQEVIAAADLIVFPSDFEGFGLPIVEGMSMQKPVIIAADPGSLEVAGGHAVVMPELTARALTDAVLQARMMTNAELTAAREWADTFTWTASVTSTRRALALELAP